jgi:hypothetical protein
VFFLSQPFFFFLVKEKRTEDFVVEVMDSVFDYPTWFTLTAGFKDTQGDLTKLRDSVLESQKEYKHGAVELGSFLENHDQPRFGSLTNDIAVSLFCSSSLYGV